MQLSNFLSTAFPGLSLGPALFYRWAIGIRFELGVEGVDVPYESVVMNRACALYEAAFRREDLGFVVAGQTRYVTHNRGAVRARFRRHRPSLFQLSRRYALGLHGPAGRQVHVSYDGDTQEITTFRWTEIMPRAIDYRSILRAKANAELYSYRPAINDQIYFVNRTRNIILHMYDDRGMDLIAAERSDLQAIYNKHKRWVLDYDRKQIEKTFNPTA